MARFALIGKHLHQRNVSAYSVRLWCIRVEWVSD